MKRIFTRLLFIAILLMAGTLMPAILAVAGEIGWQKIPSTPITLIYPGTTSYEFLTGDDHRLGARSVLLGKKNCKRCHLSKLNKLDLKAKEIAAGTLKKKRSQKPFEPDPVAGKSGVLAASLKTVYDDEFIYIMLRWPSTGVSWPVGALETGIEPDRVSLQINKLNKSFRRYGCFITCHDDLETMAETPSPGQVARDPYYAKLKRKDIHLYAYYTRDGAWNRHLSSGKLSALRKEGALIDLWTMAISDGKGLVRDGWVFDDRRFEAGSDVEGTVVWSGRTGGVYTAVFKRKLDTGDSRDVSFGAGETFSLAIAIHDANSGKRQHYVSFPSSIGIGADGADINAFYVGK